VSTRFRAQKCHLQEVIERRGHMCIFLPKFHCELNFIERVWGAAKRETRAKCSYKWNETFRETVLAAISNVPGALPEKVGDISTTIGADSISLELKYKRKSTPFIFIFVSIYEIFTVIIQNFNSFLCVCWYLFGIKQIMD